ncbi:MAG: YicC/YloC family endoribonuclease [Bacteroidales bacterium]|jgi:uncharacterized protein (TIGR00255 family)|nr:YicC family protein [Bacteroidales bacterium]
MKSMTGYGKAVCELPDKKISIEIKSVNSKQLDLNIKLPAVLRDKEPEIRSFISKKLERGKIDLYINIEYLFAHGNFSLNTPQAIKYLEDIKQLSAELGLELPQEIVPLLVRLPDVVKTPMDEVNENEWVKIFESFEKAVDNLVTFRKNEGNVMKKDIEQHVLLILQGLPQIKTFEKNRINQIKQRIQTNLESVFPQEKIDANRFEQEVIYFLEKMDFTEEKVRLKKHGDYFLQTMNEDNSNGRKLGFIAQEMGREINTLGSKANDYEIQKIVVEMKDELEKIKEQLLNVL